ncbi:NmrA family NAD(P)-binding protein [Mycolicibacterium sp. 050158]|uniref:NmrA family NAD(P)-binding protein n=1 Tax=Mycolicibacterium sp. 050158 TaxID=3090602 RepID=UPI00299CF76A|nr:NmrA family NAD(P)-binding protein [Mycolicibacterium sp. 050158]MDX1892675.1 NmrA family NAD(P)-binding protein [Mycolicibacterium sp. 050158]
MATAQLLVTGATGATGLAAVEALKGSGNAVRALVHSDDSRADRLRNLGAEIVVGDLLDIDSVHAAMNGVDAAYFVYPIKPRLLDATAYFAQAAKESGVGAIVNLSQRTSHRHSKSHAAQNHWMAERVFDWSGVPVTHLRPTLFAEWMLYPFAVQGVTDNDTLALPFGTGKFAPIAAYDQGRVIATVLSDPARHAGQTYLLNGPAVLDGEGVAAALGEGLGRPITYFPFPIEDFQAVAATIPELSDFFAQHIGAVVAELNDGLLSETNDTVQQLTGSAPMSVQDFARAHSAEFAHKPTA